MDKKRIPDEVVALNPFRCRMWDLHDRLESYINEESCRKEIASFQRHGQRQAALGRRLSKDPEYDVELVFGARRLFVARHLNTPLIVELRELTDIAAVIAMDIENRLRQDLSPYERGLSFARWLRGNVFSSQKDIASTLGISGAQVSRLLRLARLPSVIVAAFASPAVICESWGLDLAKAWEDPTKSRSLSGRARELAQVLPRLSGERVYDHLMRAAPVRRQLGAHRDQVIVSDDGAPLFRIRRLRTAIAVVIPLERASAAVIEELTEAARRLLQRENAQVIDLKRTHGRGA